MQMKRILKIGLFIVTTSIFFAACANKSIEKNVQKSKTKTINNHYKRKNLLIIKKTETIYLTHSELQIKFVIV